MTRINILAAAAAISFPVLIAAGATFRGAPDHAPQPSTATELDERPTPTRKGDRLPLAAPPALGMTNAQSDYARLDPSPPEQLPLATEDDMRQAEAEHQRRRDICPRGRAYFTVEHHQYWRCKR